jgi:four helix bundle protein
LDHLQESWKDHQDSRGQGVRDSSKMLKNYRELKVWQRSYRLCLEIYRITKTFPNEERYGLTSQIRRAAVSVPSNIAEGYGRKTTPEYIRFLYIAYGSICELETQILLSGDLGYIETGKLEILQEGIGEVERMLKALTKSLERKALDPLNP